MTERKRTGRLISREVLATVPEALDKYVEDTYKD